MLNYTIKKKYVKKFIGMKKMKTIDYLTILKNEIHSAVFATIDENGLPRTRVIYIMLADENGIYFITAKGKVFYQRLMAQKYVAIGAMTRGRDLLI